MFFFSNFSEKNWIFIVKICDARTFTYSIKIPNLNHQNQILQSTEAPNEKYFPANTARENIQNPKKQSKIKKNTNMPISFPFFTSKKTKQKWISQKSLRNSNSPIPNFSSVKPPNSVASAMSTLIPPSSAS